jgi:hypothetical protein
MKWFNGIENINWTKMWWVVGVLTAFWVGMIEVVPLAYYKPISVALSAIQSALLFASRGTKYVANRTDPPADGKP